MIYFDRFVTVITVESTVQTYFFDVKSKLSFLTKVTL